MAEEIVNKVAKAKIEQIDLATFKNQDPVLGIDIKELLLNELVLKEKEFRAWVKDHDWDQYNNRTVCLFCSNDAIVPSWAYMLLTSKLADAKLVLHGNPNEVEEDLFFQNLADWDSSHLKDQRVMVKGCANIPNPNKAYIELTKKLQPTVKSLMFGEPCSAVPVYKKR